MDKLKVSSIKSMGYGLCYKKLMKDRRLPIESKAIYNYIASYAGAGDTAFPGWKLICYDLNISKTRYYKYLNYLKAYGYITVEQVRNEDNTFSYNIFTLQEYPELHENLELLTESVDKSDSSNLGTGENTPIPNFPETENPETENEEYNINNSNNTLFYSIWNMAKEFISKDFSEYVYNEFIADLKPFVYKGNIFTFLCSDEWHKTILEVRYMDIVHIAMGEVCKLHNINDFKIILKV